MVRTAFTIFVLTSAVCSSAWSEVLFEGYSKVLSNEQHIGYIISRYEFDAKKKQFLSSYFLKTGKGPSEVTESVKAVADAELAPISYEYTSLAGKETKTIDAKFKSGTMIAVTTESGKKPVRIEKKVPKGTFLSTFLVYLMLKSKEGLRSETKYEYQAIAEEDASIYSGQALVGKEENFHGFKAYKILNTFKNIKFLSYVNDRGEVLGTNAMAQGIETLLVATPSDATANLPLSTSILKNIFGGTPAGLANVLSRAEKAKRDEKLAPPANKQIGVPQGQGIQLKTQPAPTDKSIEKGN